VNMTQYCDVTNGVYAHHWHLHNSLISNFMIYHDRLETNLLQLVAHT